MKIIIPIYYDTDEIKRRQELGIEVSLYESAVRNAFFYKISAVSSMREGETFHAVIDTGGESYVSALSPKEVVDLIDDYKRNKKERKKNASR